MKIKIILLTIICFGLLNCDVSVSTQKAHADYPIGSCNSSTYTNIYSEKDIVIKDMNYHVWYLTGGISETGYCVFVVNTTKDELECELLRKQLKEK